MKVEQDGIFRRDPSSKISLGQGRQAAHPEGSNPRRVSSKERDPEQQMLLKSFDRQQKTDYMEREHTEQS